MKASRAKPLERPSELQLFLRIKHPSLDPAVITRALGMEPEQSIAAGADVSRTGVRRLHSESYWIAKLPTTSVVELATGYRESTLTEGAAELSGEDLLAMMGATERDVRIAARLKRFENQQEFFRRINADGGSVTLIVDRGDAFEPVVLKHSLKMLAELGIALEVD